MKAVSVSEIKKELVNLDNKTLQELCMRLSKYKVENKHEDLSKGAGCFKCEPIEIKDFQYDHRRFSDRPSTRYDRIVKMIETGEAMR